MKRPGEVELKWINSILKKDNYAKPVSRLALSDLDAWLDQEAENPEFEKKIKDVYSEIASVAVDLSCDIELLRCAAPKESAPPILLNAGLAARDALIVQMKGLSEKLGPPPVVDVGSAEEYHSRLVKGIGNTILKFGRAQSYVAALFPGKAERLNSDLNRISHLLVDLDGTVNRRQSELLDINAARKLGDEVVDEVSQIKYLRKNLQDLEMRLMDHKNSALRVQSDLEALGSSEKGRRTKTLKETLDVKQIELTKIEIALTELVFPLTKALERLVKQGSNDRVELRHGRDLELLIRSPQEVADSDVSGTLLELRSKVDLLGLRDKKREKIVEHLDRLIEDKTLEMLLAKHSEIAEVAKGLSKKLFESSQELTRLEETLKQTSQQIDTTKASMNQSMKSLSTMEDLVLVRETELKDVLERIAGRPVVLVMESSGVCI